MITRVLGGVLLIALIAGCPANSSSGLSSANQNGAANAAAAFEGMTVVSSVIYRDGGTIVIEAKLTNGSTAKLRLDGAMGSDTKGKFFVTLGTAAERPMERQEATPIITALEKAVAAGEPNADPRVVPPFVEALKAFRDGK